MVYTLDAMGEELTDRINGVAPCHKHVISLTLLKGGKTMPSYIIHESEYDKMPPESQRHYSYCPLSKRYCIHIKTGKINECKLSYCPLKK